MNECMLHNNVDIKDKIGRERKYNFSFVIKIVVDYGGISIVNLPIHHEKHLVVILVKDFHLNLNISIYST